MATVTGFTAERMLEIEASCIVNGAVDLLGDLTFTRRDGGTIQAGNIRGLGVQPGGDSGTAFFKKSGADYDTEWRGITTTDVSGRFTQDKIPHLRESNGLVYLTTREDGGLPTTDGSTFFGVYPSTSEATTYLASISSGGTKWAIGRDGQQLAGTIPAARIPVMYKDANWTVLKANEDPTSITGANFRVHAGGSFGGYDGGTVKWRFTDGEFDVGTIRANNVDKMTSASNYTNLMATKGNVTVGNVFQINDGGNVMGGIFNNAWKWRFTSAGVMDVGTVPFARTEDPVVLAGTGTNLNNYATYGMWHQPGNAGASAGSNYPAPQAGMLEVSAQGSMVYQRYTTYKDYNKVYTRGRYNGVWSAWKELSTSITAAGTVSISAAANAVRSATVAFPSGRFDAGDTIAVATGIHTAVPQNRSAGIANATNTGVTINLWANESISIVVSWIASKVG